MVLAGALVWWQPSLAWIDPLIAFLFAILVVVTTVILLKDIYYILMEATPRSTRLGVCSRPGHMVYRSFLILGSFVCFWTVSGPPGAL